MARALRGDGTPAGLRVARALSASSLPFVLAEVATGVLSYFRGYLSIPSVIGIGTSVDGAILAAGMSIAILWARRPQASTPRPVRHDGLEWLWGNRLSWREDFESFKQAKCT